MRPITMLAALTLALAAAAPPAAVAADSAPGDGARTKAAEAKDRPATTINWLAYDAGMEQAKAKGKPVLLSFWADWCGYCKKMESKTYADPRVAAEVMANFVPISVNTTNDQKLAMDYYVRGLPTIWFLESDGTKITALPGYVEAPMFLKVLRFIDTRSYEKMDFQAFLDSGS